MTHLAVRGFPGTHPKIVADCGMTIQQVIDRKGDVIVIGMPKTIPVDICSNCLIAAEAVPESERAK